MEGNGLKEKKIVHLHHTQRSAHFEAQTTLKKNILKIKHELKGTRNRISKDKDKQLEIYKSPSPYQVRI